jgi:hypothetical protein
MAEYEAPEDRSVVQVDPNRTQRVPLTQAAKAPWFGWLVTLLMFCISIDGRA